MQVKAWCYYESRLLGAPHGLLSTYALETMVLYIFNFYHNSLQTPCQVCSYSPWKVGCSDLAQLSALCCFMSV